MNCVDCCVCIMCTHTYIYVKAHNYFSNNDNIQIRPAKPTELRGLVQEYSNTNSKYCNILRFWLGL